MNIQIKTTTDMKQTNHKWYSTSNGKKLLLASLAAILGILVFLIIKFTLIEWVYIAISLLAITGMVVYNLLFRATPQQEGAEQSNAVSELKAELAKSEQDNSHLNNEVIEMKRVIETQARRVAQLEQQQQAAAPNTLDGKYTDCFILMQTINRWMDALPESDQEYVNATRAEISRVLASYGYMFLELTPDSLYCYDYERVPIDKLDKPKIAGTAIVTRRSRSIVIKGKAFIPDNYGKQ